MMILRRFERLGVQVSYFGDVGTPPTADQMRAAEGPLTTALVKGLLTPDQVQAGQLYADLYQRAGIALPTAMVADPLRVRGQDNTLGSPQANDTLRAIWDILHGDPMALIELSAVCLLNDWPEWISTGRPSRRRTALRRGLAVVLRVTGKPAKAKPKGLRPYREMAVNDDGPVKPRSWMRAIERERPSGAIVPGQMIVETAVHRGPEGETLFEAVRRRRVRVG
jgi:hypothetical protein